MSLDPAAVRAAAAAWVWVPEDAREVRTDEFRLVAYPEHFADPTVALRLDSARPPAALVDAVLAAARGLGRPAVTFAGLTPATRPAGLEAELRRRGARLHEELAVLALDLAADPRPLDPPPDVEVRAVEDLATRRDLDRVETTVFGGIPLGDEELAASLVRIAAETDAGRYVAYRDGRAVGAAGCTFVEDERGGTLRLWGGGVVEEARHTGVYRALLDARLRLGRERGLRTALVKGRLATSAPVLRRAGFAAYGEERSWRLDVPAEGDQGGPAPARAD